MTDIRRFDVRIPIRSPFLFESIDPSGLGLDSPALRDRSGRALIPGDHVRGHLAHAVAALCKSDPTLAPLRDALFGAASPERRPGGDEQDLPRRGRIDVADFRAELVYRKGDAEKDGVAMLPRSGYLATVRVSIDDVSGAAAPGALQFIELVAPPGGIVTFKGTIHIRDPEKKASEYEALLKSAFRLISAMGGSKSVGFGIVLSDEVSIRPETDMPRAPRPPADVDRLEVTVKFDRPILVDAWSNASNLFRGSTVVPGAAIKGALATLMSSRADGVVEGTEGDALARVLISHAFPVTAPADGALLCDRAVPMSMAATVDEARAVHFADAIDPAAVERLLALSTSGVAYPGDWKGDVWRAVRKHMRRPSIDLQRSARGRVGISEAGIAEKGKLFVVAPVETLGQAWRFVIDRRDADPVIFARILDLLAAGLSGIGRTGARLEVVSWSVSTAATPAISPYPGTDGVHVVLLETGAMLTDPTSSSTFADQYAAAFRALAGSSDIELVTHFAQRRTIGGFLAHRYRRSKGVYVTSDLTLPGSVFVLKGGAVPSFLARALREGLGAVQFRAGKAEVVTDWRVSPFVPENGWGEISVAPVDCATITHRADQGA